MTGVADRWCDNRCPGRRGKHRSHGRGREQHRRRGERRHYQRKIAGIAGGGYGKQSQRVETATIYGRREEALSEGREEALSEVLSVCGTVSYQNNVPKLCEGPPIGAISARDLR